VVGATHLTRPRSDRHRKGITEDASREAQLSWRGGLPAARKGRSLQFSATKLPEVNAVYKPPCLVNDLTRATIYLAHQIS